MASGNAMSARAASDIFTQHGLPSHAALQHLPPLPSTPSSRRLNHCSEYTDSSQMLDDASYRRTASVHPTPQRHQTRSANNSATPPKIPTVELPDDLSPPRTAQRQPSTPITSRAKKHRDALEGRAYPVLSTRQSLTNLARTAHEAKFNAANIPLPPSPVKEVLDLPKESEGDHRATVRPPTVLSPYTTETSSSSLMKSRSTDEVDARIATKLRPVTDPRVINPTHFPIPRLPSPSLDRSGIDDEVPVKADDSIDSSEDGSFELDIEALRPQRSPMPSGLPLAADLGYRQAQMYKAISSPSKCAVRAVPSTPLDNGHADSSGLGEPKAFTSAKPPRIAIQPEDQQCGTDIMPPSLPVAQDPKYPGPALFPPGGARMTSRVPSAGAADRSTILPVSPAKYAHLLSDEHQIAREQLDEEPSVFLAPPPPPRTPRRADPRSGLSSARLLAEPPAVHAGDVSSIFPISPAKFAHLLGDEHQLANEQLDEEPTMLLAAPPKTPRRHDTLQVPGSARMTPRARPVATGDISTLLPVSPAKFAHLLSDEHQIAREELIDEDSVWLPPPTPRTAGRPTPKAKPAEHVFEPTASPSKGVARSPVKDRPQTLTADMTIDLRDMMAQVSKPKRQSGTEESFEDLLHGSAYIDGMDATIGDESFLPPGLRPSSARILSPSRPPAGAMSKGSGSMPAPGVRTAIEQMLAPSEGPVPSRQAGYPISNLALPSLSRRSAALPQTGTISTVRARSNGLPTASAPNRVASSMKPIPSITSASHRNLALPAPAPVGRAVTSHRRAESLSDAARSRPTGTLASRAAVPLSRTASLRSTGNTEARSSASTSRPAQTGRVPSIAVSPGARPTAMGPPAAVPRPADRLSSRAPSGVRPTPASFGPRIGRAFGADATSAVNAAARAAQRTASIGPDKTSMVPATKRSLGPVSSVRPRPTASTTVPVSGRALSTPAFVANARTGASATSAVSVRLQNPVARASTISRMSDAPSRTTSSALPAPRSRVGSTATPSTARPLPAGHSRSSSLTSRGLPTQSSSAGLLSLRDKVDRLAARQTAARQHR